MKKKNTAKKAVLPALLAVLCSTAALTSVSYAWFTMGNTASVQGIDVNVQTADGLQISHDAATWGSILDASTLSKVDSNKLGNADTKLLPTSSVGSVKAGQQEIFFAELQKDKSLLGKTAVAGVDYLMFDLYIKVDSEKDLSLDTTSSVVAKKGSETQAELASRVSFVDLGSVEINSEFKPNNVTGLDVSKVNSTAVIWEPNAKQHTAVALGAGATKDGKDGYQGIASVAEAVSPATLGAVTLGDVTTFENTSALKVAELEAGVNKLRVYIWLEGQDLDCTNDIAAGAFTVGLDFSVPEATENA